MKSWGVTLASAGLVVAGVAIGVNDDAQASLGERCRDIARAAEVRRDAVTGSGTRIAVIGDSYAEGLGLDDPATSWPARLDGRVVVDGFSGSGFSAAASPCRGVAYSARVDRALTSQPSVVVVEGGLNDFDVPSPQLRAGARAVLHALEGHPVVVVGPPMAPQRASSVPRVDRILASVAAEVGVPYIRTTEWELEYLPDQLHLTEDGHETFGDNVRDALDLLGLT